MPFFFGRSCCTFSFCASQFLNTNRFSNSCRSNCNCIKFLSDGPTSVSNVLSVPSICSFSIVDNRWTVLAKKSNKILANTSGFCSCSCKCAKQCVSLSTCAQCDQTICTGCFIPSKKICHEGIKPPSMSGTFAELVASKVAANAHSKSGVVYHGKGNWIHSFSNSASDRSLRGACQDVNNGILLRGAAASDSKQSFSSRSQTATNNQTTKHKH